MAKSEKVLSKHLEADRTPVMRYSSIQSMGFTHLGSQMHGSRAEWINCELKDSLDNWLGGGEGDFM